VKQSRPTTLAEASFQTMKTRPAGNYGPKTDHLQPCWLAGFKLGLNSK
jgi:hypothetical protein